MLGEKLKALREAKGYVQRQVAAELAVDSAYISKMENNDKPVSKSHLKKLAVLFDVCEDDLHTIWLADRVYQVVKSEKQAVNALKVVVDKLMQSK